MPKKPKVLARPEIEDAIVSKDFFCKVCKLSKRHAEYLLQSDILFLPAKAANAGGVATSALEMSQNSERLHWTFDEVDAMLKKIMVNLYHNIDDAAKKYGFEGNFVVGANIAGFEKVMEAMMAQGIV